MAGRWSEKDEELAISLYLRDKLPIQEIAARLGRTVSSVRLRLSNMGVKRGYCVGIAYCPNKQFDVKEAWLRQRYVVDLLPVESIAQRVGCGAPNIRRLLKKWEIRRGKTFINSGASKVWNRGLDKNVDARLKQISEKRMGDLNPMAGREAWNKGVTVDDDPRVRRMVDAIRSSAFTPEHREKMALAKRGKRGADTNNWRGGISFTSQYVLEGKLYQHRVVAERILGRALQSGQHVHHVDRDRRNNEPTNLLVMTDSVHLRLHAAMRAEPGLDQRSWLSENGMRFEQLLEHDPV
ncbi:hypothetical protein AWB73_01126 [Caballeronia turbans]|nr:hypothetical protein AWB73_01126 [Caballeronia turbans]